MGSANTELEGPDLAEGVELAELEDGKPLLGHARGEALVLVRSGNEVFATGATCTHYSGPLAQGLVVGRTLRCPWHHACFSLETGEAVRGPALSSVPCFAVLRDGTRVKVGDKREPPKRSLDSKSTPASITVVGAGAAGAAAVETLRREGYRGPILLLGDEEPGPVDRPNLSKDYLAGTAPEQWIPLRSPEFYRELDVQLVLGDPAEGIDPKARTLTLKSGKTLSYGALLLATGARPRKLDVPGAGAGHVHLLRTLADSRAIIRALDGTKGAVVIGASFIGLEVAASLRQRELSVAVVAPDAIPLARILGDEIGLFVQKLHEEHGVRFHLGRKPARIEPDSVTLDDGQKLPAPLVVVGVGVAPRTELAERAGLEVNAGIVVDTKLRTSADDIFAAGDVARYPEPISGKPARVEHWVHAERQGQAAARNMLGKGEPFADPPFFWSQHYDVTLAYVGHAPAWDRIETRGELAKRDFAAAYVKDGSILAVLTVGRDLESLRAEAAFERGSPADLRKLFAG